MRIIRSLKLRYGGVSYDLGMAGGSFRVEGISGEDFD